METHSEKVLDTKRQPITNNIQKRKNGKKAAFYFVDNRPISPADQNQKHKVDDSSLTNDPSQLQSHSHTKSTKKDLSLRLDNHLPLQLLRTSHGRNKLINNIGISLFLNSHLTTPERNERFDPHCTTQVSVNRQRVGSIRTYYNNRTRTRRIDIQESVMALRQEYRDRALIEHRNYVRSLFG